VLRTIVDGCVQNSVEVYTRYVGGTGTHLTVCAYPHYPM
jgi:hypothetical protein